MHSDVQATLYDQIRMDLSSGYVYLAMAAQFEADSREGFAHWMRLQAQQELDHAMKLFDQVNRRGGRVVLQAIPCPPEKFGKRSGFPALPGPRIRELLTRAGVSRGPDLPIPMRAIPATGTSSYLNWFCRRPPVPLPPPSRSHESVATALVALERGTVEEKMVAEGARGVGDGDHGSGSLGKAGPVGW